MGAPWHLDGVLLALRPGLLLLTTRHRSGGGTPPAPLSKMGPNFPPGLWQVQNFLWRLWRQFVWTQQFCSAPLAPLKPQRHRGRGRPRPPAPDPPPQPLLNGALATAERSFSRHRPPLGTRSRVHYCQSRDFTTRRAPTPPDASYIPDTSGPDTLYDTVRRVVQCRTTLV